MVDREQDENSSVEQNETEERQEDFATLFEASMEERDSRIQRDSKIEGVIVSIGDDWIFLDIGGKSEGSIAREEFIDKEGNLTVGVGDRVTAYVLNNREGEILLSVKMTAAASEEAVRGAYSSGVPVEGSVSAERKGGYSVTVLGKSAFCPYSQIDLHSGGNPEEYVGKRFTFRITEYSEKGRNIVVSRRAILEEERQQKVAELKKTLRPGDVVRGAVQRLTHFGAFVDIGGIEGLIPMSELAWWRVGDVSEILSVGEEVAAKILNLDWTSNRVSLSLKQTLDDPWASVAERYAEEIVLPGTVTRLMNYGAFVQLEPGVEGLVHVSNLGMGRRINHPREVLNEGDAVEVRVLSVDPQGRRIGLELIPAGGVEPEEEVRELKEGDILFGTVDSIKDYGIFVALPGRKSGLLHISEIAEGRGTDLRRRFPLGSQVEVQIRAMEADTGKISLSTRTLSLRTEESQFKSFADQKGDRPSFGTLGDLLKDKLGR